MHPAPSVIIFTVFSGVGFGFLTFLGFGVPNVFGLEAFVYFAIAFACAVGGLMASTFHLGNPQRALLAFTQWKTSWLSREGWLAVLALVFMGLYAAAKIFWNTDYAVLGWIGSLLSVATVFATSMIYQQLKTVPRWNQPLTSLHLLSLSLSGGAILAQMAWLAPILIAVSGVIQLAHWKIGDQQFSNRGHSQESATGLGYLGKVRLFEPPHTGGNYLLKEMVFEVGRKHAAKLRMSSLVLMIAIPLLVLLLIGNAIIAFALAAIVHVAGAITSRWLFFAEAEHVVKLYYGKETAT